MARGGLAERLLGTTSSSLPAYAYCPIVVVPYTDDEGNLMHLNNTITKVAVGSDESKWGLKALEIAAAFADSWGAELDVISAVPNMKGSEDEGVMASFQEDLDVRIKPLEEAYPNLKINKQIVPGPAAGALTKASYDHDVVVVGSVVVAASPVCCSAPPARVCCSMRSDRSTWCRASMWKPRKPVSTPCRARLPTSRRRRSTTSRASRKCRSTRPRPEVVEAIERRSIRTVSDGTANRLKSI